MKLVFATNNKNKLKEVQQMLPSSIELITLEEIGCLEEIPETANTIEENAIQKAKYIKENYNYNVFADDTGLEVKTLNNAPGVYSARYAGEQKNSDDNINLLLKNLENNKERSAQFKTIFALCIGEETFTFEGIVKGTITNERFGEKGFGYDPIFMPEGYDQTFAQMPAELKNKISHRAIAVKKLVDFLKKY
ncbi:MAG: non-canonical purine NTP diphosphatase [Capnocytophaga sp.]|nr:non-canonical purine NTP diphosphatase [Capnocytophaga sp.]